MANFAFTLVEFTVKDIPNHVNAAAILEHDNVRGFANANHKTGRRFRILDYTLAACSGRIILQPESDDVIFKDEIAERIVDASILANSVRMYNVLLNLRVLLVDYRVIISLVLRKDAARDPDAWQWDTGYGGPFTLAPSLTTE